MANSLRDQLLKAGLVTEEQVEKAGQKKPRRNKPQKPRVQTKPNKTIKRSKVERSGEISLAHAYSQRSIHTKNEEDAEKKRQREIIQRRREIKAKLRQIIKGSQLNDPKAELVRNFTHGNKIKRIYVTPEQQKQLGSSELGIVMMSGRYYLLALENIEKVREVSADAVIFVSNQEVKEPNSPDEDYAGFEVPDDLVW